MTLWRVDVAGVSHRYVPAESADAAVASVEQDIVRALDLRATPAPDYLDEAYDGAGPLQRKKMIAAMDGLSSPRTAWNAGMARRQLNRIVRMDEQAKEWSKGHLRRTPPVDVIKLDLIVKGIEVQHLERNLQHLDDWQRNDNLHGGS